MVRRAWLGATVSTAAVVSRYNPSQIEAYYRNRLDALNLGRPGAGDQFPARCPLQDDNDPSLSVNLATGQFFCHGLCETHEAAPDGAATSTRFNRRSCIPRPASPVLHLRVVRVVRT